MYNLVTKIKKTYLTLSIAKKAVIWFTIATIIQNGILFISTPIYTRILSDAEYGVFSIYQSWQQIISIISVLALDRCITVGFMKYAENRKEFLSSIQTLMTLLVFIFSIVIIVFQEFFEKLINLPIYIIITMLIVALMNNSLANWSWYQRYNYNYKKLTIVTVFSTFLMQVIAVIAVLILPFKNKGNVLVMSMSLARLLIYGVIYLNVIFKGKVAYKKDYWKFALRYSIAVIPHALSQIVLNSSDRIMIDKICGRAEAAYYGVTYSAASVVNIVLTSISTAVQPHFFEKIKSNDFESIRKQTNSLLIISCIICLSASLIAPEILTIMAPSSYEAALWTFPSIAAGIFFNSMYLYFANFESYYEKPFYFSIATTVGATLNIILNYILIPIFGFIVAGYTTLVCYIIFALLHYLFMRKICNDKLNGAKPFDTKFILILSIIVVLSSIMITISYSFSFVRYFIILLTLLIVLVKYKKIISKLKMILNGKEF